ncbi:hypothetical protein B0H16DRAFT_1620342 [Mycena metata]|uniref:Uncharacterized protein n=1 Tax=Mycena metata TaxID=1033252 RepID=A0AAD7H6L7_9AGAR|nr:hypothetical protein B0H16DRAFT_1620342 [Mycena metata]
MTSNLTLTRSPLTVSRFTAHRKWSQLLEPEKLAVRCPFTFVLSPSDENLRSAQLLMVGNIRNVQRHRPSPRFPVRPVLLKVCPPIPPSSFYPCLPSPPSHQSPARARKRHTVSSASCSTNLPPSRCMQFPGCAARPHGCGMWGMAGDSSPTTAAVAGNPQRPTPNYGTDPSAPSTPSYPLVAGPHIPPHPRYHVPTARPSRILAAHYGTPHPPHPCPLPPRIPASAARSSPPSLPYPRVGSAHADPALSTTSPRRRRCAYQIPATQHGVCRTTPRGVAAYLHPLLDSAAACSPESKRGACACAVRPPSSPFPPPSPSSPLPTSTCPRRQRTHSRDAVAYRRKSHLTALRGVGFDGE